MNMRQSQGSRRNEFLSEQKRNAVNQKWLLALFASRFCIGYVEQSREHLGIAQSIAACAIEKGVLGMFFTKTHKKIKVSWNAETNIRKPSWISFCIALFFCVWVTGLAKAEDPKSPNILALSNAIFKVSESEGKVSLAVMKGKDPIRDHMELWKAYMAKPCTESVAQLRLTDGTSHAEIMAGDRILAFMECGMWDSDPAEYVVAIFHANMLDAPQCASIINLAKVSDSSWTWGRVKSFDVRKLSGDEINVVITAGGGDAGRNWQSLIALRVKTDCTVSVRHTEYSRSYYESPRYCEGETLKYRFLSNEVLEITRQPMADCVPPDKRTARSVKKFNF